MASSALFACYSTLAISFNALSIRSPLFIAAQNNGTASFGSFSINWNETKKKETRTLHIQLNPYSQNGKCSFTHNYTRTAEIRYIFAKIQVTCTKCLSSYTQTEKVAASNENEYNKTEGKNDTHTHINISWVIFWFRRW
jgi:hypothetical protein